MRITCSQANAIWDFCKSWHLINSGTRNSGNQLGPYKVNPNQHNVWMVAKALDEQLRPRLSLRYSHMIIAFKVLLQLYFFVLNQNICCGYCTQKCLNETVLLSPPKFMF